MELTGIQCARKGLSCSVALGREPPNRSGRLIEQARGASSSAQTRRTPEREEAPDQLEVIAGSPWLESEQSVGRRLGTLEAQAAVTASLLDCEHNAPCSFKRAGYADARPLVQCTLCRKLVLGG